MQSNNRHPGSIDFEPTDLSEARKVLDLPPDGLIGAISSPQTWIERRRKLKPTDRALTGASIDWLVKLPSSIRPTLLCNQFPRIANVLAEAWPEKHRCEEILSNLRADKRSRRQGFAPNVQLEIGRLTAYRNRLQ